MLYRFPDAAGAAWTGLGVCDEGREGKWVEDWDLGSWIRGGQMGRTKKDPKQNRNLNLNPRSSVERGVTFA